MMMRQATTDQSNRHWIAATKLLSFWLLAIFLFYMLLESLFFCCVVGLFPYSTRVDLGFGIYPLLENASRSLAPERYTAIFGDSYAFGSGDWFLMGQHERKPVFSPAQLLHQQYDRDVISFGIPGSSNLTGWIEDPVSAIRYINSGKRLAIAPPETIVLFFYEGNDIEDNYIDLQARYLSNGYDPEKIGDSAYFSNFINKEMLEKNRYYLAMREHPFFENLYFLKLASVIMKNSIDLNKNQEIIRKTIANLLANPPTGTNLARINGKTIALPDEISGPPMDTDSLSIETTMAFTQSITSFVRNFFPNSHIVMIYIPSAATIYDMNSETLSLYGEKQGRRWDRHEVIKASNSLCQRMQHIAAQNGISFLDTRPTMRQHARNTRLHGVIDVGHLNEAGYRSLTGVIGPFLQKWEHDANQQRSDPCVTL